MIQNLLSGVDAVRAAVEIILLFIFFYWILRSFQGSRGAGLVRGILVVFVVAFIVLMEVTIRLELDRIRAMLQGVVPALVIILAVIFQPELRRALVRLGQGRFLFPLLKTESVPVEEIVKACARLSKNRIGALIAIQRDSSLAQYVEGGVKMDAEVTAELLETIFYPGAALHDGAIIVVGDRVAAAGCLFPLTDNPDVARSLGTRHRAGIGITEETDAVTLIVSEETGKVSLGARGVLSQDLDKDELENRLRQLFRGGEKSSSPASTAAALL
ncbi:MAG: diadenylate cyclase CdaA [Planctomycetota bacterium]